MRLGRGLESLIPQKREKKVNVTSIREDVIEVDVKNILPNPHQPRQNFDQENLKELASSIREHGVLQPLILTMVSEGEYQVLAGERRLLASKMIGLKKVPAIVRSVSEQQKLEFALIENLQRHNLNPIEEAYAFQKLIAEFSLNQEEVAKKIGKSRAHIANILRLLTLPKEIRDALFSEKISFGHAKAILGLKEKVLQLALFKKILEGKFSVRKTENQAKKIKVRGHLRKITRKNPDVLEQEERLKGVLGTKVEIKKRGGKGNISIEFYSNEELDNLVDIIAGKE